MGTNRVCYLEIHTLRETNDLNVGQGKASIQKLSCCKPSAGARLRLESERLSGNISWERKLMPAHQQVPELLQGILSSAFHCVRGSGVLC